MRTRFRRSWLTHRLWDGVMAVALASLFAAGAWAQGDAGERTVWEGVYTVEQAGRGRELYLARCASCHAPDLNGGEMAPPLVGVAFQSNWNGLSAGDLSERIRLSMPVGAEGSLTRQQVADVVAAIFAAGDYPVGKMELPREPDVLKAIQITPRR
jgi:mono/diheme cytochrome c family protein